MDIRTCSASLLDAGTCCVDGCGEPARWAVLDHFFVEHTRCTADRDTPDVVAVKELRWDPAWAPAGGA